jgi:hypothetical protein
MTPLTLLLLERCRLLLHIRARLLRWQAGVPRSVSGGRTSTLVADEGSAAACEGQERTTVGVEF